MSEIGVKLTGDNAEYRAMLNQSVADSTAFADKLATKVGDKLFGLRDVSRVVATALGLDLNKIAQAIARKITGISEEEEAAYKKLDDLSTRAADAAIKNSRAQLTEEQRYQLALRERAALQEKIDQFVATTAVQHVALAEMKIKLEEKTTEILDYQKKKTEEQTRAQQDLQKQTEERQAAERKLQQQQESAQLALLTLDDRRKTILQEEQDLQASIRAGTVAEKAAQEKLAFLASEKNKLLAEEAKHRKDLALSLDEELEIFELTRKKARGLTDEEQARLDVLTLQKKEKQAHLDIETLEEKLIQGTLTPAERDRLDALIKQDNTLKAQIDNKNKLINAAIAQKSAEGQVTDEFLKQLDTIQKMMGLGQPGFKAGPGGGGQTTVSVSDLENAVKNAQSAFEFIKQDPNAPGYAEKYFAAQALVDQAERNLRTGRQMQFMSSNRPVPIGALDLTPIAPAADAALKLYQGTGGFSAGGFAGTATSTAGTAASARVTAAAVMAIAKGLAESNIITIKNIHYLGAGGAPDTSSAPEAGLTLGLGGAF